MSVRQRPIQRCTHKGCAGRAKWRASIVMQPFIIYNDQREARFPVRSVVCDDCKEKYTSYKDHVAVDLEIIRMRQTAVMQGKSPMDLNRTTVEFTAHS